MNPAGLERQEMRAGSGLTLPELPLRAVGALLLLALTTGCGADSPDDRVIRRDSAGVEIVESTGPAWAEGEGWSVDAAPMLDLAESGEGPEHEFFRVTDATLLSDGTVVVASDGDDDIRLFSAEGEHLRTLGGPGHGPGEFNRLDQVVALPGDSILAYDYWEARITIFDPEGRVARIARVHGTYRPRPLFPVEGGGFVGKSTDFSDFGEEPGVHRLVNPIVRVGDDGSAGDTLTRISGHESVVFSLGSAGTLWGKNGHLAVRGDRVYLGSADSVSYRIRSPGGRLLRIVRVPGYDLSLGDDQVRAEREVLVPDPSEADPARREIMDLQPDRDRRPGYEALLVDAAGYVWLQEYQGWHEIGEPVEFLVFDPSGAWLGSVTLPSRFEVFRIGDDWILGKRTDDLDVEHVQLLRLTRGSGSSD